MNSDFIDSMGSESPNNQASPIKEASPIKTGKRKHSYKSPIKTGKRTHSDKSQSKQKKLKKEQPTDDDFTELASRVHWPSSSKLNRQDDDRLFQIYQSSETPNREHSNEKENEYIEYLKYAFCVSSLKCRDKTHKTHIEENALSDATIFGKPEYEDILRNVYKIKDEYSKKLHILNKELLFIKDKYPTNNNHPIGIIIDDLQKIINRFDGKKKKGGKKSYKKKSTKKSRTKKARK
jgi:hypothetical protein